MGAQFCASTWLWCPGNDPGRRIDMEPAWAVDAVGQAVAVIDV